MEDVVNVEREDMRSVPDSSAEKPTAIMKRDLLKFLIPTLLGIALFLMPIPKNGYLTVMIGIIYGAVYDFIDQYVSLATVGMVVIVFSAVATILFTATKPGFITKNKYLEELFIVSPLYLVSRIVGAVICIMTIYSIGPELIRSRDTGGVPVFDLVPILLAMFTVVSFAVNFLTDFGFMEYVEVFARKMMRKLFTIPGKAFINSLAAWLGSAPVGVIVARRMHADGVYTAREASVVATTFCLVDIGYVYVMVELVGLPHMYFQMLLATYLVALALAFIMPRIWPLSKIPDTYFGMGGDNAVAESVKRRAEDDAEFIRPEGVSAHQFAVQKAVEKARTATLKSFLKRGFGTMGIIFIATTPVVVAWATGALILAGTPVIDFFAYPFLLLFKLIGIPEAQQVAQAFVLTYPDQFLGGVIGAVTQSEVAKFMCAGISITGLIFLSEVGVLILNSDLPIGFRKLTAIYSIRAVISALLLAPFAFFFAG